METNSKQTAVAAAVENLLSLDAYRSFVCSDICIASCCSVLKPEDLLYGTARDCKGEVPLWPGSGGLSSLVSNGYRGDFPSEGGGILLRRQCDEIKNVGGVPLASDTSPWPEAQVQLRCKSNTSRNQAFGTASCKCYGRNGIELRPC